MLLPLPLPPPNRLRLAQAYHAVPRVDLSIDGVLEAQMGRVFVDDLEQPGVYLLQTAPFVYLAGDPSGPAGTLLDSLAPGALIMPSAAGRMQAARAHFGAREGRASSGCEKWSSIVETSRTSFAQVQQPPRAAGINKNPPPDRDGGNPRYHPACSPKGKPLGSR